MLVVLSLVPLVLVIAIVWPIVAIMKQREEPFLLGTPAVFAQAVAIALATAFNFAFHHLFTYRGAAHKR